MKNKNMIIAVALIIVLSVSFYVGMRYGEKSASAGMNKVEKNTGNFGRRANDGQRIMNGQTSSRGNMNGGDFIGGQIVSRDDNSITVKTRDGGSKIIFFSQSTNIDKSTIGVVDDLNEGQQITANGKNNPDGSLSAQGIQIRSMQNNQQ